MQPVLNDNLQGGNPLVLSKYMSTGRQHHAPKQCWFRAKWLLHSIQK